MIVRPRQMLRGRWLGAHEAAPVLVVNEAVGRRDFPGSNPIGRRIEVDEAGMRTIVGVVGDAPFTELGVPVAPEVVMPYADGDLYRLGGLMAWSAYRPPLDPLHASALPASLVL